MIRHSKGPWEWQVYSSYNEWQVYSSPYNECQVYSIPYNECQVDCTPYNEWQVYSTPYSERQVYSLQSNDQTQQTQGSDRSTASTDRVPTGFCFKTRPPSHHSFFQSEAKTEKRSQSVTVRGLTIVQRSWWWAMTMSPSCQTRSVATQPAPEAPETSIPAHRPIVNTAFLATSLWFNPFPALITSHLHGEGFLSCYTASHLNSECLCMLWRNQVLETGHPA